jgi:probable rRNA maturation factor
MILFHIQEVRFELKNKQKLKNWIKEVAKLHGKKIGEVNYVFMTDELLYEANVAFLNHNTYTDIITFDNSEPGDTIDSDIYISIDRVKANSLELNIPFDEELKRVIIHGILHLCGFKDKSKADSEEMRKLENEALKTFQL